MTNFPIWLEINKIYTVKVYDRSLQPPSQSNPCSGANVDCQSFCFARPAQTTSSRFGGVLQRHCGCPWGQKINGQVSPPTSESYRIPLSCDML